MSRRLDEEYVAWLYSLATEGVKARPRRTFWFILRQLHEKEFVWFIPNDDNRVEDGRALRDEFLDLNGYRAPARWPETGCSMLEMMIALSRRLSFEDEGEPSWWFWVLMRNLNLDPKDYHDESNYDYLKAEEILDRVIHRTYTRDGHGGLFPLNHATRDQRRIEIWTQLNAYLLD